MFRNLRRYFYQYFLNKELKHFTREAEVTNLKEAQYIGILFNATDGTNLSIIRDYVKKLTQQKKKVKVLAFVDEKNPNTDLEFKVFSRKNINWHLNPKGDEVQSFMKEPFDLLVNAFLEESEPMEYIAAFSKAKFKVGPYFADKTYCFDMMISKGEGDLLTNWLDRSDNFLMKLNSTEAVA